MKTITQITYPAFALFALACFALSPTALAVTPAPDRGYPNQNTAEDDDALSSRKTGADSTAMGFDALDSDTTGSDEAVASWSWRVTRRLNTARYLHTATLLQNGMVLVAGGYVPFYPSESAELYDPASATWSATGSLTTVRAEHTGDVAPKRQGPCCRWL